MLARDRANRTRKTLSDLAQKLRSPLQVQKYLRSIPYNSEKNGETLRSAYEAICAKKAHCLEATFVAAALLEYWGYPPLVMSLESQDDLDHVLFVFKHHGKWGSISRSRDEGLHGRAPLFSSLKDLAKSYLDPYVDHSGRVTGFGVTHLDLSRTDWRYADYDVWETEQFLIDLKHSPLKQNEAQYQALLRDYREGRPLKPEKFWW